MFDTDKIMSVNSFLSCQFWSYKDFHNVYKGVIVEFSLQSQSIVNKVGCVLSLVIVLLHGQVLTTPRNGQKEKPLSFAGDDVDNDVIAFRSIFRSQWPIQSIYQA